MINLEDVAPRLTVFSGGDLQAYVGNEENFAKVPNLESITFSKFKTGSGKWAIVGSMVLAQYNEDALVFANIPEDEAFNISLVGVTKYGDISKMILEGVTITQITYGWSQSDLGNSVGLSFEADNYIPWSSFTEKPIPIHKGTSTIGPFTWKKEA